MNPISFFVHGDPKGQPRPRAFAMKVGNKYQARVFDSGTAEGWKAAIAVAAKPYLPAEPMLGPLSLRLEFLLPRPKNHFGSGKNGNVLKPGAPSHFTNKPDVDNFCKAVMDALTILGMWKDDSQVCWLEAGKAYCDKQSGVQITIEMLQVLSVMP